MNRRTEPGNGVRQPNESAATPAVEDAAELDGAKVAGRILQFVRDAQGAQFAIAGACATALNDAIQASAHAKDLPGLLTAQGAFFGTVLAETVRRQGQVLESWTALQSELAREWSLAYPMLRPASTAQVRPARKDAPEPGATLDDFRKMLDDTARQWTHLWESALTPGAGSHAGH